MSECHSKLLVTVLYLIFLFLSFGVINRGSVVNTIFSNHRGNTTVICVARHIQQFRSYIITCMLIMGDKPSQLRCVDLCTTT
jgi:hypothetical protein